MSLVYLNAFTNTVEATATCPADMTQDTFAYVEAACRAGRMYDVAREMQAIIASNPKHPDCFLVPSERVLRTVAVSVAHIVADLLTRRGYQASMINPASITTDAPDDVIAAVEATMRTALERLIDEQMKGRE